MPFPQMYIDAVYNATYCRELEALRNEAKAKLQQSNGYEQTGDDSTAMECAWHLFFLELDDAEQEARARAQIAANLAEMEQMLAARPSHQQ